MPPWLTTLTRAPEPAWVRVSACEARTPFVKAALWAQPAEQVLLELTSTVPVKAFGPLSSRLPKTSKARTLTLKGLPAVWSPSGLPAVSEIGRASCRERVKVKVVEAALGTEA